MKNGLIRIQTSTFTAGAQYRHGRITRSAPILAWLRGKHLSEVIEHFERWRPGTDILVLDEAISDLPESSWLRITT